MSVYAKFMNGDTLSFTIFEGYKFRNLRGEIYDIISEEEYIPEIECVLIFDNNEKVDINDLVTEGNTYNIFINELAIILSYENNKMIIDHEYESFPKHAIVIIKKCVSDNLKKTYNYMYDLLDKAFQEENDYYDYYDYNDYYENNRSHKTFLQYVNENYDDFEFEDIVKEYISFFISRGFKIKEFLYE